MGKRADVMSGVKVEDIAVTVAMGKRDEGGGRGGAKGSNVKDKSAPEVVICGQDGQGWGGPVKGSSRRGRGYVVTRGKRGDGSGGG